MRVLLARLLAKLAPSVPPGLRAQAEIGSRTPVPGVRGEAHPGSGQNVPGGFAVIPVAAALPAHPDMLLNWRPMPELKGCLSDTTLALVVGEWAEESR